MIRKTPQVFRNLYEVFASGLTLKEIERLINVDAREMYSFFVRHVKPEKQQHRNSLRKFLAFCWNLFLAFLLKLTPARRLFYGLAIFGMLYGIFVREFSYTFYSFVVMNFLLALEVADKLITKDELTLARDIQLSLLPNHVQPPQGYDIAAYSDVASSVGGDYYDLISLADGSSLVVIGDVSGKGISAALYMVKVQTALQLLAKQSHDPRELLIRLNHHLYGQLKKNYFLTISLLQIFPDGAMKFCRAGHTPALLCDCKSRTCTPLQPPGAALGLAPSGNGSTQTNGGHSYEQMIEVHHSNLQNGDLVFLYTDGIVDSVNQANQEFGDERLKEIVSENAHTTADGVKSMLVQELTSFRAGVELRDDTTFVVVKRV